MTAVTHGMDTAAGRQAGEQIRGGSDEIRDLAQRLDTVPMGFDWTGTDAERLIFTCKNDRVRFHVFANGPGEEHRPHFFLSRLFLGNDFKLVLRNSVKVSVLDQHTA